MSIADRVNADLPFLRRFARSLTGSQAAGDAAVVATLEAIIADPGVLEEGLSPRVALYKVFLKSLNAAPPEAVGAEKGSVGSPAGADAVS
jgi:hypothetical protein